MAEKWMSKNSSNNNSKLDVSSNNHSNTRDEVTLSNIRMMDENSQKNLLFDSIRACDIATIKNIFQINRNLVNAKLYGFEGADVYDIIKSSNNKSKRCYNYTGHERDGYFYPLHLAAESGHKKLTLMLVKAGADILAEDYRGDTADKKANGEAIFAFYELRGLSFAARERYEGKLDREGRRIGQGDIYFKPEGYLSIERLIYRGGFKNNLYHGHGTLYWPGTDIKRYVGRFNKGEMHGRGTEFDKNGLKTYHGYFRHNQRDGRGEEYSVIDNNHDIIYRGEFSKNTRHGFGVAIFGNNHRYIGRFIDNNMSGLGIYCHPNGDRFEGMFYCNKPDGTGSFYEKDMSNGYIPTHGLYQMGKKIKDHYTPFIPKSADLPNESNLNLLHAMTIDDQKSNDDNIDLPSPLTTRSTKSSIKENQSITNVNDWKIILAKYCKLTNSEGRAIGLTFDINPNERKQLDSNIDDQDNNDNDETIVQKEIEEDMINEVNGIHFVDFTVLFVAYIYVYSASKVFEGRSTIISMAESAPDLEAVYQLVLETVETYNDNWEFEFRLQEEHHDKDTNDRSINTVEEKRLIFMNEREKIEEELRKQRAELAAKKGVANLHPERENRIRRDCYLYLENELCKLLNDTSSINNPEDIISVSGFSEPSYTNTHTDSNISNKSKRNKIKSVKIKKEEIINDSIEIVNEFASELLYIIRTSYQILH